MQNFEVHAIPLPTFSPLTRLRRWKLPGCRTAHWRRKSAQHGRHTARMIGIAVLSITGIFHAAPMLLLQNAPYLDPDMQQQLARLSLDLHSEGYSISLLFFGTYCLLLGVLIWRSRLIPKWVGALMMAGGTAHLFNNFAFILAPDFARQIPDLFKYPPLLGELALALWLVFFGIRTAGDS